MTASEAAPSKDTRPLGGIVPPNEAYVLVVEDNLKKGS